MRTTASTNHRVVTEADTRLVVMVDRPLPGPVVGTDTTIANRKQVHNKSHRQAGARGVHVFARMKNRGPAGQETADLATTDLKTVYGTTLRRDLPSLTSLLSTG